MSMHPRAHPLLTLGLMCFAFQLVHVSEHGLQVFAWAADPAMRPWMSPWAASAATELGGFCSLAGVTHDPRGGPESLHLVGNVIFLLGLASFTAAAAPHRLLRRATVTQTLHVAEHLVLVTTLVSVGEPIGVSTGFGMLTGATGSAVRVWFHFGINAVATGYAVAYLFTGGRHEIAARWGDRTTPMLPRLTRVEGSSVASRP